jgi:hypothetical protein
MNEELEIQVVVRQIRKAKKSLSDIRDSVDPVSPIAETLGKISVFLEDSEKEATEQLKSVCHGKIKSFLTKFVVLLVPATKLLKVLAEAGRAVGQLMGKN